MSDTGVKPVLPTETPAYHELEQEVKKTKEVLVSERDKPFPFEVEYPDGTKKTVHFKRLRAKEWAHVTGVMHNVGMTDVKTATREQLDAMNAAYCLALGYASADKLNAQDWLELDDKLLTETCFLKLMDISGVSKAAIENLNWFHQHRGGPDAVADAGKDGKVAP